MILLRERCINRRYSPSLHAMPAKGKQEFEKESINIVVFDRN